jgi:hypothetical protein
MNRSLFAAVAIAASAAAAHAETPALSPMAFLAGHCWKGNMAMPGQTDEHCFAWLYGGMALRDTHVVRTPGQPDYVGESTYYYDSARKQVEYVYIENFGGISRGVMQATPGALVFPATQYVSDGQTLTYRARWSLADAKSYEAFSETEGANGVWTTQFKVLLKRVD